MDAFEELVAEIFWREGYWVQQSVKVALDKNEKKSINRPSSPRWEIDVVAYKGATNQLLLIECKSYLDSGGVSISAFDGSNPKFANRFKLFHDTALLDAVAGRLVKQLSSIGACPDNVVPKLGLVAGHINGEKSRKALQQLFKEKGWFLHDELWLEDKLTKMAKSGYENSVAAVTAKLILRGKALAS